MFPGNAHGELVTPHWILEGRLWLKVTLEEPILKPDSVLVALEAEGQDLLLELEKKQKYIPGHLIPWSSWMGGSPLEKSEHQNRH